VPVLAGLDATSLTELAGWFDVAERESGSYLIREGWICVLRVQAGAVRVAQGGNGLASSGSGGRFGELPIVGDGHRTASVVAASPVTVWCMLETRFRGHEAEHRDVAQRLRRVYV
jgi:CRP-like cAMP-binding protein